MTAKAQTRASSSPGNPVTLKDPQSARMVEADRPGVMTHSVTEGGKVDDPVVIVTWIRGEQPIYVEEFDGGVCTFTHDISEAMRFASKKKAKSTAFLHGLMGDSYAFKRKSELATKEQG